MTFCDFLRDKLVLIARSFHDVSHIPRGWLIEKFAGCHATVSLQKALHHHAHWLAGIPEVCSVLSERCI